MAKTSLGETLKKNLFVIIFVILAIIASATIYYSVKSMSPTVPVIIASDNIRVGSTIKMCIRDRPAGPFELVRGREKDAYIFTALVSA